MKNLSKFELSVIKRTAKTIETLNKNKGKIVEKMKVLEQQLADIDGNIDIWETPVKALTGGFTSDQVLKELYLNECSTEGTGEINEDAPLSVFDGRETEEEIEEGTEEEIEGV